VTLARNQPFDPDNLILIVFTGDTDILWLRILKRGFRHCFACIHLGGQWFFYDPLAHTTDVTVQAGLDSIDLEFWFRQHGCKVVRTTRRPVPRKKTAPAFFTCVEALKRLLGVRGFFILTPWQLYRHLENQCAGEYLEIPYARKDRF